MKSSLLHSNFLGLLKTVTARFFPAVFASFILSAIYTQPAVGQVLPTGFNQVLVTNGIVKPTVMAFAPDGRLFVAQQTGELLIIKNGVLLPQPFISLSVSSSGERGLLGIAFDPAFASNNFIYLYYTLPSGTNNHISRFTANGDVALAGSEVPVLDLDPLSSATNHNGGTMQFGPDGKLYIGVGENANRNNAPNLDTYLGKILRINSDGSVPAGNPFPTGSNQRRRIWGYGLRNPYTISFQPGTGRLFINDVGEITYEEINDGTTGGLNFGWPDAEGSSNNLNFANPVYFYSHGSTIGQGCAITGGTFFNPPASNYPASYNGKYFYIDYCGNWIDVLTLSGGTATRANFASNIGGNPVSLITGPDGNLYFLSRTNSAVYKITFTPALPTITINPVADAQVRAGVYANTNYGNSSILATQNATNSANNIFQSYLRFNIGALGGNSISVKLRLYGNLFNPSNPSATVQVYNVPSLAWGETTITYNHRPAAQTTLLASAVVTGTTGTYYDFDLTDFINARRNAGATAVSLEIRNATITNYNQINFYSKEKPTNRPQLLAIVSTPPNPGFTANKQINDRQPSIAVYPNPASGHFTVEYPAEIAGGMLQMIDMSGKTMFVRTLKGGNTETIETKNLQEGMYILLAGKGDKQYSQRVMVGK